MIFCLKDTLKFINSAQTIRQEYIKYLQGIKASDMVCSVKTVTYFNTVQRREGRIREKSILILLTGKT